MKMSEAIMTYPTLLLIWIGLLSLGYLYEAVSTNTESDDVKG